ncbi:hypothetical protein ACFQ3K_03435 [Brucella gallinifaecis]|uniref:Uncharacterized protein n=1 Tax=Brucella gallinifaecis TaxID=215590 RepID=A0A502BPG9_9HYPH|nr:hypothetical protein [Brucella gallinifaecis]TPF75186.1 hypothetical protein FHY56_10740 [Brucella gallinifaecis]
MSLSRAIRAAVTGRSLKSRLEEDKPEELEDDERPEEAEDDPKPEEAEDEPKPEADEDEPVADEDKDEGEFARGRRAERKRMSAILSCEQADGNTSLAAHLAFSTNMSAKNAIATLKASGPAASAKASLSSRMNGRVPALGSGGGAAQPKTADAKLVAFAKNRAAARKA